MSEVIGAALAAVAWLCIGMAYAVRYDRTLDADTDEGRQMRAVLSTPGPLPPKVLRRIIMALVATVGWPWIVYCDAWTAASWVRRQVRR